MNARARGAGRRLWRTAVVGVALAASGCARPTTALRSPSMAAIEGHPVELSATPFFAQETHQCGPAALATILTASGAPVTPADLSPAVYLPGRRGSLQFELLAASRRHGRLP